MKRLLLPMFVLALALPATPTFAQSRDFGGSWALDVEKTGSKEGPPTAVITMTDKEISVKFGGPASKPMMLKLDGSETVIHDDGRTAKTKATWNGNKLDATVTHEEGGETVTISRDGAWLVLEPKSIRGPAHGPLKLYFKKA